MKPNLHTGHSLHTPSATAAQAALDTIQASRHAFCLYRLPGEPHFHLIAGDYAAITDTSPVNTFLVRPFAGGTIYGIRAVIDITVYPEELPQHIHLYYKTAPLLFTADKAAYMRLVEQSIQAIEEGQFEKVVTSRCQYFPVGGLDVLTLFQTLSERYPQAFVYLLSTPEQGSWMGATPELLLQKSGGTLETVALAGTRTNTSASAFTEKEIHEQQVVSDYILQKLQNCSEDIQLEGPALQKAGHLLHLITRFKARVKKDFSLLPLLEELHPTPAVCGLPKKAARAFILEHELYPRSLYSGYLGYVGEQDSRIFVNLRCMQLFEGRALLYGGGGIVKGSVPEKEWEETVQKMNTLLQYLPVQV